MQGCEKTDTNIDQNPNPLRVIIGIESFEEAMDKGCYYVDKTLFIKHVLDHDNAKVQLYTRPRRFGKTLLLSMVKCFFGMKRNKDDILKTKRYFEGMKIYSAGERYISCMNSRPVIFLSFASVDCMKYQESMYILKQRVSDMYAKFAYLENRIEDESQRESFNRLLNATPKLSELSCSLNFLSKIIYAVEGKKAVILIDEYDTPLHGAFENNYYQKMLNVVSLIMSTALDTNNCLDFAIVCGCMRISDELLFASIDNNAYFSVTSPQIEPFFGFTEPEVKKMLQDFELEEMFEEVNLWYNGYLIGDIPIYNPWSIANFIFNVKFNNTQTPNEFPQEWANSSSHSLVRNLISKSKEKDKFELLLSGKSIYAPVYQTQDFYDIYSKPENIWSILLFAGYLKPVSFSNGKHELSIPNQEVMEIYRSILRSLFNSEIKAKHKDALYQALINEDESSLQNEISNLFFSCIGYWDISAEGYYHGFVASTFDWFDDIYAKSNTETGNGIPYIEAYCSTNNTMYLFEIKTFKTKTIDSRIKQMLVQKHIERAMAERYRVVAYVLGFSSKRCYIKKVADSSKFDK
ncbi:MAG: AAA family ATPase [Clostridiales bacterium]|nr:AAA family ATPase [Clostridiales bacterium]